jgi:hypothetical protein
MQCYILSTALYGTETGTLRKPNRSNLKSVAKDVQDNSWTITFSQGGYCIFQYIPNKMQLYTVHIYTWKLLYMFRAVPPPIIRSAYNCI